MTKTRHGHTNFEGLQQFISDMLPRKIHEGPPVSHKRYQAAGFMPLVFERLYYTDYKGRQVYSMTHYGEQNGDAMRDPDLTFSVDMDAKTIEPQTFQNDYLGLYQEVYKQDEQGRTLYSQRLRSSLDEFLWQWLKNIEQQGYTEEVPA